MYVFSLRKEMPIFWVSSQSLLNSPLAAVIVVRQ
jgi:hypothetical protein